MLRRMNRRQRNESADLLKGNLKTFSCGEPHDGAPKPDWPNDNVIDSLRRRNLAVSHFHLQPGEYVHIGKARLHAFRKHPSRAKQQKNLRESICISFAWDWIYEGSSRESYRNEIETVTTEEEQNSMLSTPLLSLANIKTCILQGLVSLIARAKMVRNEGMCGSASKKIMDMLFAMLPVLGDMIKKHENV